MLQPENVKIGLEKRIPGFSLLSLRREDDPTGFFLIQRMLQESIDSLQALGCRAMRSRRSRYRMMRLLGYDTVRPLTFSCLTFSQISVPCMSNAGPSSRLDHATSSFSTCFWLAGDRSTSNRITMDLRSNFPRYSVQNFESSFASIERASSLLRVQHIHELKQQYASSILFSTRISYEDNRRRSNFLR